MTSTTDIEEATNRQRLLVVAGKAGLKAKHVKKIKEIFAKYPEAGAATLDHVRPERTGCGGGP